MMTSYEKKNLAGIEYRDCISCRWNYNCPFWDRQPVFNKIMSASDPDSDLEAKRDVVVFDGRFVKVHKITAHFVKYTVCTNMKEYFVFGNEYDDGWPMGYYPRMKKKDKFIFYRPFNGCVKRE